VKLVRRAAHAGLWYSANPVELDMELTRNLQDAERKVDSAKNTLKAIIGPHAGLRYSGPNAAWGYKNIDPAKYDRVFLIGPSHKVYLDFIATTLCSEYETPLGNLPIDMEVVKELCG